MSTLSEFQTILARELRDSSNVTFSLAMLTDLLNAGVVEVSQVRPKQFLEDVTGDGSYSYTLDTSNADVRRVEVFDGETCLGRIPHMGAAVGGFSQSGWDWWNESLILPKSWGISTDGKTIRVYGYAPYVEMAEDTDDPGLPPELEKAVIEFAVLGGYQMMMNQRVLFTQWQAQANNTDVSMNSLISAVAALETKWQRRKRQLATGQRS